MSRTFTMPELAESVVEGEIVKWLVAEGEPVQEDQPLLEVMTDKVTVEIPSPLEGVLEAHLAAEGDVVRVGAPWPGSRAAATPRPRTTRGRSKRLSAVAVPVPPSPRRGRTPAAAKGPAPPSRRQTRPTTMPR